MKDFQKRIDEMVSKILKEEIEKKSEEMSEKLHGDQHKLDVAKPKGKLTKADFEKLGDMKEDEDIEEQETEEGNAFSGALADAKKQGKDSFEVDGKKYQVKESEEKWIQKTDMKKGALRKKLGVPEGEKIPKSKLNSLKKDLMSKSKGDKKLSASDAKLLKQVNLALTLGDIKESKESLRLTESELIDLIESIVKEQKTEKKEEPKENIKIQTPIGLTSVQKANKKTGEISDAQIKDTAKKIAEYMKDGSKEKFTTDPKHFPKGNGELAKMDKKTYKATTAVEDYVDNFTAAGLENLVYDEIHPDEEWVDKNIEGSSITGNNPEWANAVETGVNKKRNQIRKDNLLGAVKQMAYNKAPQPTEETENPTTGQKFNKNFGKGSGVKANKILNQLESTEEKGKSKINEDMEKMKNLISYNRKTQ
jgi:hypothetical protein